MTVYKNTTEECSDSTHCSPSKCKSDPEVGTKRDAGKLRFDLIPPIALQQLASVYTYGAAKYNDRNWEKGVRWSRYFAAAQRHLWAFWGGENTDFESQLSHLAHAAWCCLALLEYSRTSMYKGFDDRPENPTIGGDTNAMV